MQDKGTRLDAGFPVIADRFGIVGHGSLVPLIYDAHLAVVLSGTRFPEDLHAEDGPAGAFNLP